MEVPHDWKKWAFGIVTSLLVALLGLWLVDEYKFRKESISLRHVRIVESSEYAEGVRARLTALEERLAKVETRIGQLKVP